MRYLGITLDGRLNFETHFVQLRLLPNIDGPNYNVRRLYAGVINSMTMYGTPVWHHLITGNSVRVLNRIQRKMAIRVIRGYRTVSYETAITLAGMTPFKVMAEAYAVAYSRVRDIYPRNHNLKALQSVSGMISLLEPKRGT